MAVFEKLAVIALLFLATLASGIWLGRLGGPLNPALSTVHKLLALAWVIFAAIRVYHAAKPIEVTAAHFASIAILTLSVVALFVSGSLLTVPKLEGVTWLAVHRIASVCAVVAFAFTLRLFFLNKQ